MRFGRKKDTGVEDHPSAEAETPAVADDAADATTSGPLDATQIDLEAGTHIDLGSLLVRPIEGSEVRMQVDEQSGDVLSVLLIGEQAALEMRAFAAPTGEDIWEDIRRQIAAEVARQGGTADHRDGPFGTELFVQQPITTEDGQQAIQPSRVIGCQGPRWLLRATLLGAPAMDPEQAARWETAIRQIGVRRGSEAMAPGEALPLSLPADARKLG